MTGDLFLALVAFAFVSSITPGPNNLMLMASGANFGIRRTVPHMLGVAIGFVIMAVVIALGLAQVFEAVPILKTLLTVIGIAYLLYLAWKIANAAPPADDVGAEGKPMTFLQAALFQWVNVKAWMMAVNAITLYSVNQSAMEGIVIALVFGVINLPCVASWAVLGQQMQRVLTTPARLQAFNWLMAGLLVASLYPVVASGV